LKEMEPGKWIRALREERSIKASDIERTTRSIADARENPDFYVSHSTLADIESGAIPGIHKLFSLALALKVPLNELLLPFGIDQSEMTSSDVKAPKEANALPPPPLPESPFRFQLNFDTNTNAEETTLLKIQSHDLAILPPPLRARFDPTRYRYASIGSKDDIMADLLPPKSLVEIDTIQKSVQVFAWQSLRERPIYLVWHADGHTCSWCQSDAKELIVIPHPLSRQRVRRFRMPTEAIVIGRVTNAWLPFDATELQREAAS
jgi:transcriptional regulator with XRE-family HTH domain